MSCYAYEVLSDVFISDAEFDALGASINANWDTIQHRHKHLVDKDKCKHTSALTVKYKHLPTITLMTTHQLLGMDLKQSLNQLRTTREGEL